MVRRGARPRISFADMTLGERIIVVTWIAAAGLLPIGGVILAVVCPGAGRAVGIVLLFIGLIAVAVPISPILGPRLERRASPPAR